jgi:hypothetical protein
MDVLIISLLITISVLSLMHEVCFSNSIYIIYHNLYEVEEFFVSKTIPLVIHFIGGSLLTTGRKIQPLKKEISTIFT